MAFFRHDRPEQLPSDCLWRVGLLIDLTFTYIGKSDLVGLHRLAQQAGQMRAAYSWQVCKLHGKLGKWLWVSSCILQTQRLYMFDYLFLENWIKRGSLPGVLLWDHKGLGQQMGTCKSIFGELCLCEWQGWYLKPV